MYALLLTLILFSFSKESNAATIHSAIFRNDTIPAQFPGGMTAWGKFLIKKMDRDIAVKNGAPEGTYTTIVDFLVDTTGSVSDIQVLKNAGYGTDAEAIRLMKISPKWIPATKDGQNISSRHKQSFTYNIAVDH